MKLLNHLLLVKQFFTAAGENSKIPWSNFLQLVGKAPNFPENHKGRRILNVVRWIDVTNYSLLKTIIQAYVSSRIARRIKVFFNALNLCKIQIFDWNINWTY